MDGVMTDSILYRIFSIEPPIQAQKSNDDAIWIQHFLLCHIDGSWIVHMPFASHSQILFDMEVPMKDCE